MKRSKLVYEIIDVKVSRIIPKVCAGRKGKLKNCNGVIYIYEVDLNFIYDYIQYSVYITFIM
ncbi:hypothetical protein [Paraclostridium sordellii]|uniref:hypothetical protein n=1 Tax=Paraclostridium sordellii TaxID=1505 RepID=UPI0005DAC323|nr:hypothetical protein [Paeniclostridium sordellii]CEO26311.1 Uncharacterised protein [[Clostridium] sordellii] [Paeniclostridium sordellii]